MVSRSSETVTQTVENPRKWDVENEDRKSFKHREFLLSSFFRLFDYDYDGGLRKISPAAASLLENGEAAFLLLIRVELAIS
jgi:hypothetical protein